MSMFSRLLCSTMLPVIHWVAFPIEIVFPCMVAVRKPSFDAKGLRFVGVCGESF